MTQDSRPSEAFERLHPKLQRWIDRKNWDGLRSVQKQATPPILKEKTDVVIAAATAGGKTEAAFLPIATRVAEDWAEEDLGAFSVLYVSPLKALINDQAERLEELFSPLHVPVFRWHGDVSESKKRRARKDGGVLLITPESLEAQLIRRGHVLSELLAPLRFVVIDELHAFIGSERGRQLQSLLHRVELTARHRIPRVALSATLGDMGLASEFLRPGHGEDVVQIVDETESQEVRLEIRGYEHRPPDLSDSNDSEDVWSDASSEADDSHEQSVSGDAVEIAKHLFETLRGGQHIVFANRRSDVELFTDLLHRLCERERVPNEFAAHHGSLSRQLREETEARLRRDRESATIVATSTLELGIDVGSVESIGQIGPPPTVASMKQRLGRSGREEDAPATLRIYVRESSLTADSSPIDRLRIGLVQSVAMVRRLIQKWVEPPLMGALHLSTLVQQTLSLVAQHGGLEAHQGYEALCGHGPFQSVSSRQFAMLLRDLGKHDLIKQTHDGALVLDLKGEKLVNHYDFYAAFSSPEEYRLLADGETIGSLPVYRPLDEGTYLIFGGERWEVVDVDTEKQLVQLNPAGGGKPPKFAGGSGVLVREEIRSEMEAVYEDSESPLYLNEGGTALLQEAREEYQSLGLDSTSVVSPNRDTWWFPWTGDRALNILALELRRRNLDVAQEGPALRFENASEEEVEDLLTNLRPGELPAPKELADLVRNKDREKHHRFLRQELLAADYASADLDFEGAREALSDRR